MCVRVETDDTSIVIDPSAAIMHPSYPLEQEEKLSLRRQATSAIQQAAEKADHIIVTHYHYDHHFLPSTEGIDFSKVFDDKELWIKDPNQWVNFSQWKRSRQFVKALYKLKSERSNVSEKDLEKQAVETDYRDPLEDLQLLQQLDEKNPDDRRERIYAKRRKTFIKRTRLWNTEPHICEPTSQVHFADGQTIVEDETRIRITQPLFHGVRYARTGWVIAVVIEKNDEKFLYSSDIQGPTIEDYAQWIIDENPDFLILDGPATYLLGYMVNRYNLQRAMSNTARIIEKTDFETLLYDHHVTRDTRFRSRTKKVWDTAKKTKKNVLSYREVLQAKPPLVETL